MAQRTRETRRRKPPNRQFEPPTPLEAASRSSGAPGDAPPSIAGHDFAAVAPLREDLRITTPTGQAEQQADQVAAAALQGAAAPVAAGGLVAPDVAAATAAPADFAAELAAARSRGRPLEHAGRAPLEGLIGAGLRDVRIHADRRADRMSRSIGAAAFTSGRDIFFRQGRYQPESRFGRGLLAHELTHVAQQGHQPASPFVQRFTEEDVQKRAHQIWEEKGSPQQDEVGRQADYQEAQRQLQAQEDMVRVGAQRNYDARQVSGAAGTAESDWLKAEGDLEAIFTPQNRQQYAELADPNHWAFWKDPNVSPAGVNDLHALLNALWQFADRTSFVASNAAAREQGIVDLENRIAGWISTYGVESKSVSDALLMLKRFTLSSERRKLLIIQRIEDSYGLTFDNLAGVRGWTGNPANDNPIANLTRPQDWKLEELEYLETALSNYAPLLGNQRPQNMGAQPLDTLSRAQNAVTINGGSATKNFGVMGVTFPGSQNVTMYDNALSLVDFASSGQQFRGTIEHEFSHALIEPIQTGQNRTMIDDFADAMDFWDGINLSNYWQDDVNGILDAPATRNDAGLQNVECPITDYGMTNAQEDLAEAMMFFFEDPAKLQSDCPERFTFIADNIGQYLNQEYMQGTIDPLRNPQPVN